jgi:hypothetical protein
MHWSTTWNRELLRTTKQLHTEAEYVHLASLVMYGEWFTCSIMYGEWQYNVQYIVSCHDTPSAHDTIPIIIPRLV